MTEDAVKDFGKSVPMKRPGQPAELATAYVMLADPLSSYVSGATICRDRRQANPVNLTSIGAGSDRAARGGALAMKAIKDSAKTFSKDGE